MSVWLAPFDPSRQFVALRFFRAGGIIWERGAAFDKSTVNARTLQLLYGNRSIGYPDQSTVRSYPPHRPKPKAAATADELPPEESAPAGDDQVNDPTTPKAEAATEVVTAAEAPPEAQAEPEEKAPQLSDEDRIDDLVKHNTKAELQALAKKSKVDLDGLSTKTQIAEAIVKAGDGAP